MRIAVFLASFLQIANSIARIELAVAVVIVGTLICAFPAAGGDIKIFDDGTIGIWARADLIAEGPITLKHNGVLVDDPGTPNSDLFDGVEIYDQVPGTSSFPLTWVDLIGNGFIRMTYQKRDGATGNLGTSVVGYPSFRTSGGVLQFLPTITTSDVETGLPANERMRDTLTANFGSDVKVTSVRSYPDPVIGFTSTGVTVSFNVLQSVQLDDSQRGNDAFRFITVSSMFSTRTVYDANILRWEAPGGQVKTLRLTNSTPRDAHLLPAGTQLGCWFELLKEPGSTWFPDSPTIRVEISDCKKVSQHLGIQGFLSATLEPNNDSLSVWIEWIDVPNPIPVGTSSALSIMLIASAPKVLPVLAVAPWIIILLEHP